MSAATASAFDLLDQAHDQLTAAHSALAAAANAAFIEVIDADYPRAVSVHLDEMERSFATRIVFDDGTAIEPEVGDNDRLDYAVGNLALTLAPWSRAVGTYVVTVADVRAALAAR